MKNCFAAIGVFLSSVLPGTYAQAQMTPEAAEALQRPVAVERDEAATSVPLIPHMGKLALDATLNGEERRFIFDTGSPTMISRELADELELEVIGSNIGRDANGREFKTDIAIVDRLAIGGAVFRSVPVLIADFGVSDPDRCFFDRGVIGSEIFPGSVWHIDAERQALDIAANIEALDGSEPTGPVIAARLHDLGYPHAPIFDYSIGSFADRGLFDTGSSDTVTLFEPVARDGAVQRAMVQGSVRAGRGSHGISAAGLGKDTGLLRFELEGMRLGGTELGRLSGTTRSAPPSLIGLGILDTHSVTLDYTEARLLLHPRSQPEPSLPHPGYALMATDGIRVVQLFEGSDAQKAGLRLGDRVISIGDHRVPFGDVSCETKQWLIEAMPTYSARRLTVLRGGQQVEINLDRPME